MWRVARGQPWLVHIPVGLNESYLRKLVGHTRRVYFAFALGCDDSDMGRTLDGMLWHWHNQANVLHKLFLAEDRGQGAGSQLRAIEYVCVNRAEISGFFQREPLDLLERIGRDRLATEEVKRLAAEWLKRLSQG